MTILVTGGLGFIGSHFVRAAVAKGSSVVILDKFTYASNIQNIEDCKTHLLGIIQGDISTAKDLEHVFANFPDIHSVVNFAAESHVDRSIADAAPFIQTNFVGVSLLLEFLRKGHFGKFIQVSTDEVYGSTISGSWDESAPLEPRSPYSASKASAELLCEAYRTTHSLDITVTRCANNYGTHQSVDKLIPKVISLAAKDLKIPVYGDGTNVREWLHVTDHVSALISVMNLKYSGDRSIYNIAGESFSNLEIIHKILTYMDKPFDLINFVTDRKGHDFRYSVNDSLIKSKLGWKPLIGIEKGLIDTIDWYSKNHIWVENSQAKVIL